MSLSKDSKEEALGSFSCGGSVNFPDFDVVDFKSGVFTLPGRIPLALSIKESIRSMRVKVIPWFSTLAVREIVSCTTNSQVHNDKEWSIERCAIWLSLPWVVKIGREFSLAEETLVECNFKNFLARIIKVGVQLFVVPVKTISMEIISKRCSVLVNFVSQIESILIPVSTPMKS
jgi:hypothetical protein